MGNTNKRKNSYKNISLNFEQTKKLNDLFQEKHKKSLEKIAKNPSLIGIEGEVFHEPEVDLFNGYIRIGALDLLFISYEDQKVYYIEYKCNHSKKNQKEAKMQLIKAKNSMVQKYRGKELVMLYVSGEFDVKELIGNEWKKFN